MAGGRLALLVDVPEADGAVGNVRAEARAGPDRSIRAGDVVLVADAAAVEERSEQGRKPSD